LVLLLSQLLLILLNPRSFNPLYLFFKESGLKVPGSHELEPAHNLASRAQMPTGHLPLGMRPLSYAGE
jgi:hypothetical protein